MKVIEISVRNRVAIAESGASIVCDNKGYYAHFDFDEEWGKSYVKTARFKWGDGNVKDVVFEGELCEIPVIDKADILTIGVFTDDVISTKDAVVQCYESTLEDIGLPEEPTKDVYAQLVDLLNKYIYLNSNEGQLQYNGIAYEIDESDGIVAMDWTAKKTFEDKEYSAFNRKPIVGEVFEVWRANIVGELIIRYTLLVKEVVGNICYSYVLNKSIVDLGVLVKEVKVENNKLRVLYNDRTYKDVDFPKTIKEVSKSGNDLIITYTDGTVKDISLPSGGSASNSDACIVYGVYTASSEPKIGDTISIANLPKSRDLGKFEQDNTWVYIKLPIDDDIPYTYYYYAWIVYTGVTNEGVIRELIPIDDGRFVKDISFNGTTLWVEHASGEKNGIEIPIAVKSITQSEDLQTLIVNYTYGPNETIITLPSGGSGKQVEVVAGYGVIVNTTETDEKITYTVSLPKPIDNFVEAYIQGINFNAKTITFESIEIPENTGQGEAWKIEFGNGYRIEGSALYGTFRVFNPYGGEYDIDTNMHDGLPIDYTFRDGTNDIGDNCTVKDFYFNANKDGLDMQLDSSDIVPYDVFSEKVILKIAIK